MILEIIILQLLIIVIPVHIYTLFFENKKIGSSPYLFGVINGLTALLAMSFPFSAFNMVWDLRYTPLAIALLYEGPISGLIVFLVILLKRTITGGDGLVIAYICLIFSVILPLYLHKNYWNISKLNRVKRALIVGIWAAIVQLCITYSHFLLNEYSNQTKINSLLFVVAYGSVQILGIAVSATLHERMIEKQIMQKEMTKTVKLNTMGELAASIAHEIRNPLTVVKGFLQLMKQQKKGANQQYLTLVLSELDRAEVIISDYLNFAKPQLRKIEKIELGDFTSGIITLIQSLAVTKGVVLADHIEENPSVVTDKDRLKQAIVNFIKNAIEATPQGGTVSVSLRQINDYVYIEISDTGKGMTQEQLSRMGTVFYTTKEKGTGLGTAVSIRIIETMNGKVNYESKLNTGTKVTIQLPVLHGNEAEGNGT
ncbi:ATP-binding protein [Bacillus sp. FJAT-49736]|uniref:ATP-binding protein n=1 Tax=Bacillus sp. FJAT-49736 TaxID=2833582 RepID=UPI001BC96B46|nr:ATP-binding protein [Bacillus sp. FJAT-49736]MBS4174967.1 two-component sensor histidine kinase [Bacillus sp. FJAT-49736]